MCVLKPVNHYGLLDIAPYMVYNISNLGKEPGEVKTSKLKN